MQKNEKEKIIQNLSDCDCSEEVINEFMALLENGEKKKALDLLSKHRKELLSQFHKCNDCIGCLDYLVAKVEKAEVE